MPGASPRALSSAQPPALPEALMPISWLIGRWVGVGTGQYPTIEGFRFGQEVVFATDDRPFLSYHSRSWLLDDDGNLVRPLGTESGFWRPQPGNQVEVQLAHPTGYAEIWYGNVEITGLENAVITGARATLRTDAVLSTASAKPYEGGERLYGLVDGKLLWTFDMRAVGQPLVNHLAAQLAPAADEQIAGNEQIADEDEVARGDAR
jgi:THAP4-like, heme-binding beta-barrel domain